jgi:hypothetical protein
MPTGSPSVVGPRHATHRARSRSPRFAVWQPRTSSRDQRSALPRIRALQQVGMRWLLHRAARRWRCQSIRAAPHRGSKPYGLGAATPRMGSRADFFCRWAFSRKRTTFMRKNTANVRVAACWINLRRSGFLNFSCRKINEVMVERCDVRVRVLGITKSLICAMKKARNRAINAGGQFAVGGG